MKSYIVIALASLMTATSCSDGTMNYLNENNRDPEVETVPAKFSITDAITSSAFATVSGSYAWYASTFTEQEFGTGNNQFMKAELRNRTEVAAATTYNNEWNSTYANIANLRNVIKKTSEGGMNSDQIDILGMAQTLFALNFGVLTDLHGDVPYKEAGFGLDFLTPNIDSQETIYKEAILGMLDSAIANLQEAGEMNNAGSQDLLFAGSAKDWLGFAYALKARYLLHTQHRNPSVLSDVITAANNAIEAGFDGVELTIFNGVDCDNPWTAFFWSRYYTGSSTTVYNLMSEMKDGRTSIYSVDFFGSNENADPGNETLAKSTETVNAPAWLDNGGASIHLMSKSELYFILAEAKQRTGIDAKADFETALEAAMDDYTTFGKLYTAEYNAYKADIAEQNKDLPKDQQITPIDYATFSAPLIEAFYENIETAYAANPLKTIMVQKYIAQARDEQIEAYTDIRRCQALGENWIKLQNPLNNQNGVNYWPERFPYGNSSVISNPIMKEAFENVDIYKDKIWLFGGSK